MLRPKVLSIGSGYLSAINAEVVLQPFLQEVANEVGGSSSVTVLDELDIVYIAHASVNRAIRLTAGVGARYPVYPTSMGRVLLAFQPDAVIDAYFRRAVFQRFTEHTETDERTLRRVLADVRAKGYAAIQDELDYGIVSVSLPIFAPHGRLVAAANCSDVTNRLDRDTMIKQRLPVLRQAVRRIEGMLAQYPELTNSVTVGSDYLRPPAVARVASRWRPAAERRAGVGAGERPTLSRVERPAKAWPSSAPSLPPIVSTWFGGGVSIRWTSRRPASGSRSDRSARRLRCRRARAGRPGPGSCFRTSPLARAVRPPAVTLTRAPMPSRLLRVPTPHDTARAARDRCRCAAAPARRRCW